MIFLASCSSPPLASVPYRQSFDALGPEWHSGTDWRVTDGRLFNRAAHNLPLWLSLSLPDNVRISFTAESKSDAVDLKCELFADGEHHSSGYVVILGGWKNTKSIIARLDEHGRERTKERDAAARRGEGSTEDREIVARREPWQKDHPYRFRIERRGNELSFFVDDALYLSYYDPAPFRGSGHDRFAFNNWASEVYFDDLVIEPL